MWNRRGCKTEYDSTGNKRTPKKDDVTGGGLEMEDHSKCICYIHQSFDGFLTGLLPLAFLTGSVISIVQVLR